MAKLLIPLKHLHLVYDPILWNLQFSYFCFVSLSIITVLLSYGETVRDIRIQTGELKRVSLKYVHQIHVLNARHETTACYAELSHATA